MNEKKEQIYAWLATGLKQPVGSLTETFYYDRKYQHFFSVLFTDYFMLNENFEPAENMTSTYSTQSIQLLANKIQRIEQADPAIIQIPRIDLQHRKQVMNRFVEEITDSDLKAILTQRVKNQDGGTRFDFYFGNEASQAIQDSWQAVLWTYLEEEVEKFLNRYRINLETVVLLDLEETGTITIDLTKE